MSYDPNSYQPEDLPKGKMDSNVKGVRSKTRVHRPAAQPTQSSQQPQFPQGTPTGQYPTHSSHVAMSGNPSNSYYLNPTGHSLPPPHGPATSQQAPLDFDGQTEDLSKGKLGSNVKGGGGQPHPSPQPPQLPRGASTGQNYPSHGSYAASNGNPPNNYPQYPSPFHSPPPSNNYVTPNTVYATPCFNTNTTSGSPPQGSSHQGYTSQVPPLQPAMGGNVGGFAINLQPPSNHFLPQQALNYHPAQHTGGRYPPQQQTGGYPPQGSYSVANPYSPPNNTINGGYEPQIGGFSLGPRPPTY